MNKAKIIGKVAMALAAFGLLAGVEVEAQGVKSGFQKPNVQALKSLKAAASKPFSEGWVFIDGKYIDPPYKVERYGNVIRINGLQVTKEVVPWNEFLKTQPGVKVSKKTLEPAPGGEAPPPEPEPEAEESEEDDLWDSSLDDLFDDEPSEKKAKKAPKKSAYKPKPKKPSVQVSYTLEGDFVMNDKAKALLDRVNTYRTKIDTTLRNGGLCCFSSRYAAVTADSGTARQALERLPEIMRTKNNRDAFTQAIRNAGLVYFSPGLINDLFDNRLDFLKLQKRLKAAKDRAEWKQYMKN